MNWKTSLFLLIAIWFTFFVVSYFLPTRFAVNDDISIICALSGKDGFSAGQDPTFLSVFLATLLQGLYRFAPDIPWYGSLLLLSHGLATYCWLTPILHRRPCIAPTVIYICPVIAFVSYSFLYLTFTSTTLVLVFGAGVSILSTMAIAPKTQWSMQANLFAVFSLILASLWRVDLANVSIPFAFVVLLLFHEFGNIPRITFLAKLFLPATLLLALNFAISIPKTEEENYYREFQKYRMAFNDYGAEATPAALEAAGWSPEDYKMYWVLWNMYDNNFDLEHLQKFLTHQPRKPSLSPEFVVQKLQKALSHSKLELSVFLFSIMATLPLLSDSLLAIRRRFFNLYFWGFFVSLLLVATLLLYFILFRFVARVYLPTLLLLSTMPSLKLLIRSPDLKLSFPRYRLFTQLLIILPVFATINYVWFHRGIASQGKIQSNALMAMNELHSKWSKPITYLSLSPLHGFGIEYCSPLATEYAWKNGRWVPNGWAVSTPRYETSVREMGFKNGTDFIRQIPYVDGVYFVHIEEGTEKRYFATNAWEEFLSQDRFTGFHQRVQLEIILERQLTKSITITIFRIKKNQ